MTTSVATRRGVRKSIVKIPPTPSTVPSHEAAHNVYQQWLEDVSNVNISLSISSRKNEDKKTATMMQVSLPTMISRVLQSRLRIDQDRLQVINDNSGHDDHLLYVSLAVSGREECVAEAIESGGLTPRKAYLRSAPHISRVATKIQECMRQVFGVQDFVVEVEKEE